MPSASMNRVIKRTLTNQVRRQNQARSGVVKPSRAAQVNGAGVISVAGASLPSSGVIAPARGQVAVKNVGRLSNALYVPDNASSVVYSPGAIGGGPGGGGSYAAGDGITIGGSTISVNASQIIHAGSPFIITSGDIALLLRTPSGLVADGTGLAVAPKANEGIGIDGSGTFVKRKSLGAIGSDSNGIFVDLHTLSSLGIDADGLFIVPRPDFGLFNTATGLAILKPAVSGLILDSTGIRVGEGDGIDVLSTTVAVNAGEITDTARGLTATSNNIGIALSANSGLRYPSGTLEMGTPTSSSVSSTNTVSGINHGHAVTSASDATLPSPFATLLATNASGQLVISQLTLKGNLIFTGADRSITASNSLFLAPTTDLVLNPTGLILIPSGTPGREMRTGTYNDFVAGIAGYRKWDTGGNVYQMTIGKIKADELFVRVFTADEARVNRGEEFWTRSFGIVETAFTVPADEATVDVWFEEAPGLGSFKLFLPDNWILIRSIDWTTSLVVQAIWFQVVDGDGAGTNDYISRVAMVPGTDSRPSRQQWRLRRKSGGVTGTIIKAGNVAVDFGKPFSVTTPSPGQGIVHISALAQDGGPFIQIQTFESVLSDVPQFKNRVRMGNLTGTVDYSSDIFGFAAGDDLSKTPSTGFRGVTIDQSVGTRLFNVDLKLYDGSTLMAMLNKDTGLTFDFDTAAGATLGRYIRWQDDLNSFDLDSSVHFGGFKSSGSNVGYLRVAGLAGTTPKFQLLVETQDDPNPPEFSEITLTNAEFYLRLGVLNSQLRLGVSGVAPRFLIGGSALDSASTPLHVIDNSAATGLSAGALIQASGDAQIQFNQTSGAVRVLLGVDATDGKFKLTNSSDLGTSTRFVYDPATSNIGVNTASPPSRFTVVGGAIRHLQSGSSGGIMFQNIVDSGNSFSRVSLAHNAEWNFTSDLWEIDAIGANDAQAFLVENGGHMAWIIHGSTGNTARTMTHATFMGGAKMRLYNTGALAVPGSAIIGDDSFSPPEKLTVVGGSVQTDNNTWFKGKNSSGTVVRLLGTNASNVAFVGAVDAGINELRLRTGGTDRLTILNGLVGIGILVPISVAHIFESNTSTGTTIGLTIEQGSTGDAALHWLLTGSTRYMMGIDNSLGNDALTITRGAALSTNASIYFANNNTGFLSLGIGTSTPGIDVISTTDIGDVRLHIDGGTMLVQNGDGAIINLISDANAANNKWFRYFLNSTNKTKFQALNDAGSILHEFLTLDHATGYAGINETAPGVHLDVTADSANALRSNVMSPTAYFNFIGRRSNGSPTSPTAVLNGHIMFSIGASGYTSSGWSGVTSGELSALAAENFTSTAQGTKWRMWVTKIGTTTKSLAMDLGDDRQAFFPGVDAHTTANAANVNVETSSGWLRRSTSARRYKTDIRPLSLQSQLFDRLQPVLYKPAENVGGGARDYPGLIAEDVLDAGGEDFVTFNNQGQPDYVMYDRLVVLTIGEVQELKREIAELKRMIQA